MPFSQELGYTTTDISIIEGVYRNLINSIFETDFNETSFKGSGFYQAFQTAFSRDKEVDNALVSLISFFQESVLKLKEDFFDNQLGLVVGIIQQIRNLDEIIQDVNVFSPTNNIDFAGKIGISVQFKKEYDPKDETNSEWISDNSILANTIINSISAGINTDTSQNHLNFIGVIKENNQPFPVSYREAVLTPVYLKLEYKKREGFLIPNIEDIKKTLLESIEKNYSFGQTFTPDLYVSLCNFEYLRQTRLSWKLTPADTYSFTDLTRPYWEKLVFSAPNIEIVNLG